MMYSVDVDICIVLWAPARSHGKEGALFHPPLPLPGKGSTGIVGVLYIRTLQAAQKTTSPLPHKSAKDKGRGYEVWSLKIFMRAAMYSKLTFGVHHITLSRTLHRLRYSMH